ncbi:hypothetical protein DXG01_009958 [Tephrocybe rancida]|nr:hypothetical protein DXG01_009958 [Tephrocybe rancida]
MSSTETSLHWALNKIAAHIPLSCTDTASDKVLLTTLLSAPLPSRSTAVSHIPNSPLPSVSRQLTKSCVSAAQRLRDVCAATGQVDYDESKRLVESWDAAHAKQARAWAEDAFASVRVAVARVKSAASAQPNAKQKKPVFNHEYTPLLDKYFEHNAYPSAPDRALLAKKSMMSPRQIEVWFQNHRNRARKEGKPLRKLIDQTLPPDVSLDLSLHSLERQMPYFAIPAHERQPRPGKTRIVNILDAAALPAAIPQISPIIPKPVTHDPLNPPPPPHAFPSTYSLRGVNPLQVQDKIYTFPAPIWQRTPAISSRLPKTCPDMNEFIVDFSQKLHLRAPVVKTYCPSLQSWCVGRSTIPCSAPHPALVRSTSIQLSEPLTAFLNSAPPPPSASSKPTTLPTPIVLPSRRKVCHLPKRTPKNSAVGRHPGSPAPSEASTPSTSTSRSSSFSSDASCRRNSSSSSSSSSSSNLTTPEPSYQTLPEDVYSPFVYGHSFSSSDATFKGQTDDRTGLSPPSETSIIFSPAPRLKKALFDLDVLPTASSLERCNS